MYNLLEVSKMSQIKSTSFSTSILNQLRSKGVADVGQNINFTIDKN